MWAPILLVVLRLVQGFGAGAEYGGAVIMAVEHAPPGKRGLFGSFAPLGVTVGLLLANGVFALFAALPKEDFLSWGWRVPFLLSIVLILVGFYIRYRVSETPVFSEIAAKNKAARSPVIEAVKRHPREFLVVIGRAPGGERPGLSVPGLRAELHDPAAAPAEDHGPAGQHAGLRDPAADRSRSSRSLSDRIGRRPVYMGGALFSALFAFPFFMLVGTQSQPLIYLALILGISIGVAAMFGPQAAYFAELFGARLRYSGFAFARELGSILAGGPAPFIAASLLLYSGGQPWLVAGYFVLLSLITAVAVYFGPETYRSDINADSAAAARRKSLDCALQDARRLRYHRDAS